MTEEEREFLEDTCGILVGYDGCGTVESLKELIDETRERIGIVLEGKVSEYGVNAESLEDGGVSDNPLKEKYLFKHILFTDEYGVVTAGYVYKVEDNSLHIHSLKYNNRNIGKTYYYDIKELSVLEIVTKRQALEFIKK